MAASPSPSATAAPRAIAPLPTVDTSTSASAAGFLRAIDLDLEFEQPLTSSADLQAVAEGVQSLDGVVSVHSDGVRIQVQYDSTRVLPTRIRDRLRELGHPARAGTEVQNPGDAAD